ncbi:GntR family transcriptional regulator [Desulfoscipio sp. XC116]|uniref:GntR family transcriptional regulator n=1 Tax=Desulfoscipio sp. XC116 TaxID=3144975 RepID=UPI00325B2544
MQLDVNSPIPLHAQLKEILIKEIKSGNLLDRIPSERELMERFNVSRTTVREAISTLVNEHIVEKIHGKGTFITSHSVNEWLGSLSSVTETIEKMGMEPGIKLLFQGIQSDPEIGRILGVQEFYVIERLRYADREPIAIERNYYPLEIGLKFKEYDLNKIALYSVLEEHGILYQAEELITSSMPTEEETKLLDILDGTGNSSVLAIERVTSDSAGNTVEYYKAVYRADRYAFHIKLFRK